MKTPRVSLRALTFTAQFLFAVLLASRMMAQPADTSNAARAKAVVMRHMDAIGGLEAYSTVRSYHVSWSMHFPGGLEQRAEMWFAKPNLVYGRFWSEFGTGEGGFDGKVYWTLIPGEGPRIMSRPPDAIAGAMFDPYEALARLDVKYVGLVDRGGKKVEALEMVGFDGQLYTQSFDPRTGLLERVDVGNPSAPAATMKFDRYKKFGGVKYATVIRTLQADIELMSRLTGMDFKPVDPKRFEAPAAIRELAQRRNP